MRRSIISLFGQICLGLFFSKSQCFSSTDIPSETYLRLDDLAMRSIKGKVPSFSRFDLKQIADTVAFMCNFRFTHRFTSMLQTTAKPRKI